MGKTDGSFHLLRWVRFLVMGFGAGYWSSNIAWVLTSDEPTLAHPVLKGVAMDWQIVAEPCPEDISMLSPVLMANSSSSSSNLLQPLQPKIEAHKSTGGRKTASDALNGEPKQKYTPNPLWWKRKVPILTRTWTPRATSSWCTLEADPQTPILLERGEKAEGMVYIKTYKASSSTCEGIAWSIAHHVGQRQTHKSDGVCKAYTRHEFADKRMHARRDVERSLLWTFVRNPAARDLSHVYHFEIGRQQHTDMTSEDIQRHIETKLKGRQTRYLVPTKGQKSHAPLWPRNEMRKNATQVIEYMREAIIDNYDFIGMTERMTDSLAVMVLLWDLRAQDVVVLNSKRSGGYDDGGHNDTCTSIPKAVRTPELEEYFQNRHSYWNADVLLYHAVNASLEQTIDALGRDKVQAVAIKIQRYQEYAQKRCEEEAIYPCSPEGVFQPTLAEKSCYVQDAGCGHACVDRVLTELLDQERLAT